MDDSVSKDGGGVGTSAAGGASWQEGSGRANHSLSQQSLDRLLQLLDADREEAGRKYETLRHRLIRLFEWRRCPDPETLADETIDRVAQKAQDGLEIHAEDPYRYFSGVAYRLFKEVARQRRRQRQALDPRNRPLLPATEPAEPDLLLSHLRQCLAKLATEEQQLILAYHRGDKAARASHRKRLARRLGMSENALRIRAHRVRARLRACVEKSMSRRAK